MSSVSVYGEETKTVTDDHEEANYMRVFYWLAALTVIEIGVIYLPLAKLTIGIMLVGMALAKASLVGLYFMHLRYEKRTLGMVALTPLVICTLLIFALIPDLTATPHQSSAQTSKEHSAASSQ
jgi:cytochrome c oxidase subunit 4